MQKSDTKGYLSLKIRVCWLLADSFADSLADSFADSLADSLGESRSLPAELGQVLGHLAFVAFLWAKKSHFFFEKVRLVQPEN